MQWEENLNGRKLYCDLNVMGKDMALAVYGGDTPHIGCAVMSHARPSLTGKGIGVTTSVLNIPDHKDELVARLFSESIAKKKNCTVVCTCGIHVDNITEAQLEEIWETVQRLLDRVLDSVESCKEC